MTGNGISIRRNRRRRRGTTLIETTVTICLVTFLLAAVAVSLHSMYRLDTRVRDRFELLTSGAKLSAAFRDDAHAARTAKVVDARIELALNGGDEIVYSADDSQIQRVMNRDGKVVHRDSFRVAEGTVVAWSVDSVDGHSLITMTARPADEDESPLHAETVLRVECAVGMDFRFQEHVAKDEAE